MSSSSSAAARPPLVLLALVAGLVTAVPGRAAADTAPLAPVTTATVSADALPTVQINGVVWDQVVVGNRVYVTGEFSSARPAGSKLGQNETPRSNVLAYDLTTGALVTSWAPSLNAQGRSIVASADGTRIFVGGNFTQVSGVTRNRLVALDAATGAVVTSWSPGTNARVTSLAISGDALYVGGIFSSLSGASRIRLGAVSASTGAVLGWAPAADAEVMALAAPAGSGKVVAGGRFANLNGASAYGMGALDATTGALLPWQIGATVRNAGTESAIYSLSTDGAQVYGTGYTFGAGGNFEGTFAARASDGAITYVTGCRGDTYDSAPVGGVLYSVGHPHDCGMIGGNPQTNPWSFQRASAQTTGAAADGAVNTYGEFAGRPAPELLHWLPTFDVGSYTGATQAAWSVAGNASYVVVGGEFPRVNGVAQQGLTRFAVRGLAPNTQGPQGGSDLTPTLLALEPGRIRVSWTAAWDRDNRRLSYELLRGSTVVATLTQDATWWSRPKLSFTDLAAPAGTTPSYRVRVRDDLGNVVTGNAASIAVPAGTGASSAYGDAVREDAPTSRWPLNEPGGTAAYDHAGANDLTLDGSATRGTAGALPDQGATATTFAGTAGVPAVAANRIAGPDTFTAEAWIRTTTTSGGKIVGFGDSATGYSGSYDRHVYMTNDGRLVYGVHPGGVRTLATSKAYNDGQWHHVVATLGARGMELFVDGAAIGRNASVTSGQPFTGFWRVGGDNLGGWPDGPASGSFAGSIDEVAVYPVALTLDRVRAHHLASGRTLDLPSRPADAYGAAVWDAHPSLYWRLDETSGGAALDRATGDANGGTYSAGVALGEPGTPAAAGGTAIRLPGDAAQTLVATRPADNPTVYSAEVWFRTTTTRGGRLIGFGNGAAGSWSSSYDRQVWMLNDGRLRFGSYDGNTNTADSAPGLNDGAWHHVVATQGPGGMQLFVDGELAGTNPAATPQAYTGYWRLGSDNTWGGADTNDFAGSLDEAAVYDDVLPAATVREHWRLGAATPPVVVPPVVEPPVVEPPVVEPPVVEPPVVEPPVVEPPVVVPPATGLAADGFGRTVASGWGTAETGGAWTVPGGTGLTPSVGAGTGNVVLGAGRLGRARLAAAPAAGADVQHTVSVDAMPTGGGLFLSTTARSTAAGDYRAKLKIAANGAVTASVVSTAGAAETTLSSQTVAGLTYTAGARLRVRVQAEGSAPTTVRMKVWADGQQEPTAWRIVVTDATADLQGAGTVGVDPYLSGSATAAVTVRYDDLVATRL